MDNILKSNCSNIPISTILYCQTYCGFKKAMEEYFPMLIYYNIKPYNMVLTYRWTLTIVKATKQYFPVEMFIMLYIAILRLFLWMKWQLLRALLPSVLFTMLYKVGCNFGFCGRNFNRRVAVRVSSNFQSMNLWSNVNIFKSILLMEATEQYFPVVLYIMLYNFHMDETLNCSHWNKNCLITTLFSVVRFIMLSKTVLQHFQFLIARTRWL